jgi:cobaltochelatase CobS
METTTKTAPFRAIISATGEEFTAASVNELTAMLRYAGMEAGPEQQPAAILTNWVKSGVIRLHNHSAPPAAPVKPETRPQPTPAPAVPVLQFTEEETPPAPVTPKPTKQTGKKDPAAALAEFLQTLQPQAPEVDAETVRTIVIEELSKQEPRKVEIKVNDLPVVTFEHVHQEFKKVLTIICAKVPPYLAGPKGSGKSTAARKIAETLGLSYYQIPCNGQVSKTDIFGYMEANGRYVPTLFYKAYTEGGVFLIDELDAANENVLISINDAVSSDSAAFPCGMVQKHPDFICIGAGNTIGTGSTRDYTGRRPIDQSSLDRFVFVKWEIDEALEMAISPNKDFTAYVQRVRKAARAAGMEGPSPRASMYGGQLLAAGLSLEEVKELTIFNKLTGPELQTLQNVK